GEWPSWLKARVSGTRDREFESPLPDQPWKRGLGLVFVLRTIVMMVLHGYIDDSGDGDLFTLSCLHGDIGTWTWLEQDWLAMVESLNAKLKQHGRVQLTRYHAADCSSRKGEFAGWCVDEQKALTQSIIEIFKRHPLHIVSYSIRLSQLQKEIPETRRNP